MNLPQLHPEIEALQKNISFLKEELARLLFHKEELLTVVIPNIQAEYQVTIGCFELELMSLRIEVNRLRRLRSLMTAACNHGLKPDMEAITRQLSDEMKEWEQKQDRKLAELNKAKLRLSSSMPTEDAEKLKKVYYNLVKSLHPDLNPDRPEKMAWMWNHTVEAYRMGDLVELEALWIMVQGTDRNQAGPKLKPASPLKVMRSEKNRLFDLVSTIMADIHDAKSKPPYTLLKKLEDPGWVEDEQRRFGQEIDRLRQVIKALVETVDALMVSSIHPGRTTLH